MPKRPERALVKFSPPNFTCGNCGADMRMKFKDWNVPGVLRCPTRKCVNYNVPFTAPNTTIEVWRTDVRR